MNFQKHALTALICVLVLFLAGCPKKTTEPDPDNGIEWVIGTVSNYTASGENGFEIEDTITGGIFIFPNGADGDLEVAHITAGPETPLDGAMFWIKYSGDEPVQLSMPMGDNDYLFLHGFGSSNGSFDDGIDADERWHSLPIIDTTGGDVVFHLSMPFQASRFRPMRSAHRGFNHYQIAAIPAGSSRADTIAASHAQALEFINIVLDSLPSTIQDAARNEVHGSTIFSDLWAGRLAPTFYSNANYYKGFFNWAMLSASAMPMLGIYPFTIGGLAEDVIAHEVGHYMNHVLAGDTKYLILENQAPSALHGIGDVHAGRSVIVEDYAFFAEYFLTGTIGRDVDPTTHTSVLTREGAPYSIDFPSVEGFAAFLLANLHRTSQTIPRLTESGVDSIPVVGASFRDIWGIVARGATGIDQLRAHVEEYLTTVGKAEMLPVIAQRIGWRYRCFGVVTTDDGSGNDIPLANATVVQIAEVGGREYRNLINITGTDGVFTVYDAFPGNTILRIFSGADSTDYPLDLDWTAPTNEYVDLGEFSIATPTLMDLLRTMNQVSVLFTGTINCTGGWGIGGIEIGSSMLNPSSDVVYLPVVWAGNTASATGMLEGFDNFDYSIDMSITFSPNGQNILSITAEKTGTARPGTTATGGNYRKLAFANIPFQSSYDTRVTYKELTDVQSHTTDIDIWSSGSGGNYSFESVNWGAHSSVQIDFRHYDISK